MNLVNADLFVGKKKNGHVQSEWARLAPDESTSCDNGGEEVYVSGGLQLHPQN